MNGQEAGISDWLAGAIMAWSANSVHHVAKGSISLENRTHGSFKRLRSGIMNDDLNAIEANVWELLANGAATSRSPFHTLVLASAGRDGAPKVRIVVLRAAERASRTLRIHTDIRSEKVRELGADPRAAISAYDPALKIQLRLEGTVTMHTSDAIAEAAWMASAPMSRACYAQIEAPGQPVAQPAPAPGPVRDDSRTGFENFVAVRFIATRIDYLCLAASGHRRADLTWEGDDGWSSRWIAP